MNKKIRLVEGHGINDVDYAVTKYEYIEGFNKSGRKKQRIVWRCPYYKKWVSMLSRVYSERYHKTHPTYKNSSICSEWLYFSNFIKWVDEQPERDWKSMQPDKDFLIKDNKHYSPETVVFIRRNVNSFILDNGASRGDCMLGVTYRGRGLSKPYEAGCNNPFSDEKVYLGYYTTELEAHLVWKATKHKYALELAESQSDPRVAKVLRNKYK